METIANNSKPTKLWYDDMNELFYHDKILDFIPSQDETLNDQVNSIVRFCLYAIALTILTKCSWIIVLVMMIIIVMVTYYGLAVNKYISQSHQPIVSSEPVVNPPPVESPVESPVPDETLPPPIQTSTPQESPESLSELPYANDFTNPVGFNINNSYENRTITNSYNPKYFVNVEDSLDKMIHEKKNDRIQPNLEDRNKLAKSLFDSQGDGLKQKSIQQMWKF